MGRDGEECSLRLSKIFLVVLMLVSVLTLVLAIVDMFGFASILKWASGASGPGSVFRDSFINCAPEDSHDWILPWKYMLSAEPILTCPTQPIPSGVQVWDPNMSPLYSVALFSPESSVCLWQEKTQHDSVQAWAAVWAGHAGVGQSASSGLMWVSPLWVLLWVLPTTQVQNGQFTNMDSSSSSCPASLPERWPLFRILCLSFPSLLKSCFITLQCLYSTFSFICS